MGTTPAACITTSTMLLLIKSTLFVVNLLVTDYESTDSQFVCGTIKGWATETTITGYSVMDAGITPRFGGFDLDCNKDGNVTIFLLSSNLFLFTFSHCTHVFLGMCHYDYISLLLLSILSILVSLFYDPCSTPFHFTTGRDYLNLSLLSYCHEHYHHHWLSLCQLHSSSLLIVL